MASSLNPDKPCDETTDKCCDVEDVSKSISSPETVSSTQLPHTSPAENFPAAAGKSQSARHSVALTQLKGRKLKRYNVNLSDDREECWITGMAITNDGRRLLVDSNNYKVKLFSRDMQLLSSLSLSDRPWDIAVISDKEAVLTTNESLVLLGISGSKMSINDTTSVPYDVDGISKYGEKLAVTSSSPEPPSVKLIDKTGRVYWSVSTDDYRGQPLFNSLDFVTSDIERNTVTVTDWGNHTLTVLNGDTGDVIKRSVKHECPRGVTTGPSGNIYVCYYISWEVAELTGDLAEERIFLSQWDGLGRGPQVIAYDKTSGQLITSYSRESNSVDVWELS